MSRPNLSSFSIALAACNIPDYYMESRFSTKIRDVFKSAPLDINELLPDSFFNWDKIGIKDPLLIDQGKLNVLDNAQETREKVEE